jgi:hypothetical protein
MYLSVRGIDFLRLFQRCFDNILVPGSDSVVFLVFQFIALLLQRCCLGTGTSTNKMAGLDRFYWPKPPLSERMRSCNCFPHASKMPTLTYNWLGNGALKNTRI